MPQDPELRREVRAAGVTRVFIGIESVNQDTLIAAKKRQNKITEYRKLLLAWKAVGAVTYAGYILGFPNDTPELIRRDIGIIQRELPIDMMEFFCLTPLPGSEDHQILYRKGVAMDPDMNKYDTEHAVVGASQDEPDAMAGDLPQPPGNCTTRRNIWNASCAGPARAVSISVRWPERSLHFSQFTPLENVHPLQGGIFRLKFRRDRRPTFAIEPMWIFYPRYLWETAAQAGATSHERRVTSTPWPRRSRPTRRRYGYIDQALTAAVEEDLDSNWSCSIRMTQRAMPSSMSGTCAS